MQKKGEKRGEFVKIEMDEANRIVVLELNRKEAKGLGKIFHDFLQRTLNKPDNVTTRIEIRTTKPEFYEVS